MAGVQDIKRRIRGVKNMQQITGAMKMVAASKLRRAQEKAIQARPFANQIGEVLEHLLLATSELQHPLAQVRPVNSVCLLVMTADAGLCGAFNSNILKQAVLESQTIPEGTDLKIVAVGRKSAEFFTKRGYDVVGEFTNLGDSPSFMQAREIAQFVVNLFLEEVVDEVRVVYSEFVTIMQQRPKTRPLLPLHTEAEEAGEEEGAGPAKTYLADYIYDPDPESLLNTIVPKYIETQTFRSLLEIKAGEMGAKMTAMDTATKNAKEMVGTLTLSMNKARQAAITTELLEIVAGADALKK